MKVNIAIDPGETGGLAFQDENNRFWVCKMPSTVHDLADLLSEYEVNTVIVEKVGGYMPGNSGPAAVKFARHCGEIDGVLAAMKIPHKFVLPSKWMNEFIGKPPKDKTKRKKKIKTKCQQLFPNLKITLAVSDALGILCYLIKEG